MISYKHSLKIGSCVLGLVLAVTSYGVGKNAEAAGFFLRGQGASLQGASYAGSTANTSDLSTLFYNPAGMAAFDEIQGEMNVIVISSTSEVTNLQTATPAVLDLTDGNGGNFGSTAPVPAAYAVYPLNDKWNLGLSINAPFGSSTEYDEGWVGRYHTLKSAISTVTISPLASYQVNDTTSIGFGPIIQRIEGELTRNINASALGEPDGKSVLTADDIAPGFVIGAMFEEGNIRMGISYRSRVSHKLEGEINIQNITHAALTSNPRFQNKDASADLTTPDMLSVGIQHKIRDDLTLLGEASYTNWSVFQELRVFDETGLERSLTEYKFKDSVFIAIGMDYQYSDKTAFQFGIAHDTAAAVDEHRKFNLPDTDRTWLSGGFKHQINDQMGFSMGYTRVIAKDADISADNTIAGPIQTGQLDGTVESHVDILSANFSYKW